MDLQSPGTWYANPSWLATHLTRGLTGTLCESHASRELSCGGTVDQQGQQLDGELQAGHQQGRHVEQLVVVEEAKEDDHSDCNS